MAYATTDEFIGHVTADEARALAPTLETEDRIDLVLIQEKLDDASAEIDTYLAGKYSTPIAPVPRVVATAAIVLAQEALDRQGRDTVKAAAARTRTWLKDVARGVAVLAGGAIGVDTPAPTPSGGAQFSGPDRVFTDATLSAFTGNG